MIVSIGEGNKFKVGGGQTISFVWWKWGGGGGGGGVRPPLPPFSSAYGIMFLCVNCMRCVYYLPRGYDTKN